MREKPKCPSVDDIWVQPKCTSGCYSTLKRKEVLTHAAPWTDLEGIMSSEISQRKKNLYDITCMWNLKSQTNNIKQNGYRFMEQEDKQVVARGLGNEICEGD